MCSLKALTALPIFKVLRQDCRLAYTPSKSRCLGVKALLSMPRWKPPSLCSKLNNSNLGKYFVIVLSFVRADYCQLSESKSLPKINFLPAADKSKQ